MLKNFTWEEITKGLHAGDWLCRDSKGQSVGRISESIACDKRDKSENLWEAYECDPQDVAKECRLGEFDGVREAKKTVEEAASHPVKGYR